MFVLDVLEIFGSASMMHGAWLRQCVFAWKVAAGIRLKSGRLGVLFVRLPLDVDQRVWNVFGI